MQQRFHVDLILNFEDGDEYEEENAIEPVPFSELEKAVSDVIIDLGSKANVSSMVLTLVPITNSAPINATQLAVERAREGV